MPFPKDFVWGAATAAFQIEGAADEDGRGPCTWDRFCATPGKVWEDQTAAVACDHYHRYKEDVALMKQLGLKGYRFSVSWSRVMPEGAGAVNDKGLDFYNRLVDELLAAGITPFVTLYHWDYPYALYCRGGWLNADSPRWFADYAGVVVKSLGDRVRHWMTINEPQVTVKVGYFDGGHAPAEKYAWPEVLKVAHNHLLAHGRGVQAIRAAAKAAPLVGWAPVCDSRMPVTDSPADVEAARQEMFAMSSKTLWANTWWYDPVFLGRYPADGLALMGADMPAIGDEDMRIISQKPDFVGINIYRGHYVQATPAGRRVVPPPPGHPLTTFYWHVTPEALRWGPTFIQQRYGVPVYITENGMANVDWVSLDGKVHDPQRIDFTTRYLRQLQKAIDSGIDVRGYFHWSLIDNFEWADGFRQRFGLVHVDPVTQKRTPKDSYAWYKDVIASNGRSLAAM